MSKTQIRGLKYGADIGGISVGFGWSIFEITNSGFCGWLREIPTSNVCILGRDGIFDIYLTLVIIIIPIDVQERVRVFVL